MVKSYVFILLGLN